MQSVYQEAIEAMKPAIDKLLQHYEGFSHQVDKSEHPKIEIDDYLNQLDIFYPGAGKRKLKLAIRQFLTQLSCFRYRVIAKTQTQTIAVWNPLEQTLSQFVTQHLGKKIVYHNNNLPYPTVDIISDWVSSQIHEEIAAD